MTIDVDAAANDPKAMSNDEGSVTEHSIKDKKDADVYTKGNTAASAGPPYGIRFIRSQFGDTV